MLKTYIFPLLISLGFAIGLGFWDYVLQLKDVPIFLIIVVLNTYCLILIKNNLHKNLKLFFVFIFLLLAAYIASGTGLLQGHMSIGIVASLLQSNTNEAIEFISVIQIEHIIYAFILFLMLYIYMYLVEIQQIKYIKKLSYVLMALFNVASIFCIQTAVATVKYQQEEEKLYESNYQQVDWQIQKVNAVYQNQVVIIGESVQKDYLSLYGYDQKTTPFLNSMPVHMVMDYIATAPNTVTSLTRTLALTNQNYDIDISKNVVSLAKQAGYNTIWISNQGFMGKNDTAVSKIAIHADHQIFLKSGNYMSANMDDNILLNHLDQQLAKYPQQKNVIFLHMMGSHPDACERLFDAPRLYPKQSETLNCYLSSLNKLDQFIETTYSILKKHHPMFSLHYFSDHGMTIDTDTYYVDNEYQHNYQVPFFVLSSDAIEKKIEHKTISAYDYMHIYADFLGIQSKLLDPNKSLTHILHNDQVKVFDWENYVLFKDLKHAE